MTIKATRQSPEPAIAVVRATAAISQFASNMARRVWAEPYLATE